MTKRKINPMPFGSRWIGPGGPVVVIAEIGINHEGSAETWAFLDRRIADVLAVPRLLGRARRIGGGLPSPFRLLRRGVEAARARRTFGGVEKLGSYSAQCGGGGGVVDRQQVSLYGPFHY